MANFLIGLEFNVQHGGGVTTYRVMRRHRDAGYFECEAVDGVSGTHHFLGSLEIFSRRDIESEVYRFGGQNYDHASTPDGP